ncbi:hypothetical protein ABEB36_005996 [Hypothenemus hampei]|uniref:NADH dehydrogenase [ubiquinone] flavoprotein 3, mitochondrial n=1 Tax=Hypothenemus hampei TaxID=57062 RepID=A0ABD1F098_HYPHA
MFSRALVNSQRSWPAAVRNVSGGKIIFNKDYAPSSSGSSPNVPGLSEKVVKIPKGEVGPGASKKSKYPNPEYFCYDKSSYFEAEVELLKYRCAQPSAHSYYEQVLPK